MTKARVYQSLSNSSDISFLSMCIIVIRFFLQLYNHRNETYLSFETEKVYVNFANTFHKFFEIGHNANSLQRFDDIHEILHHILDILHGHASVERRVISFSNKL